MPIVGHNKHIINFPLKFFDYYNNYESEGHLRKLLNIKRNALICQMSLIIKETLNHQDGKSALFGLISS